MELSLRVVFVAVSLVAVPIASQEPGQCDFPTDNEVRNIFLQQIRSLDPERTSGQVITATRIHFTCLARVALDKYSWASVVINFTISSAPNAPQVRQFQLRCASDSAWARHPRKDFDWGILSVSMPFEIETEYQCAECVQRNPTANYDDVSNCLRKYIYKERQGKYETSLPV